MRDPDANDRAAAAMKLVGVVRYIRREGMLDCLLDGHLDLIDGLIARTETEELPRQGWGIDI